jgi:membrane-associated protease RseP (regulator of RpoE activity)
MYKTLGFRWLFEVFCPASAFVTADRDESRNPQRFIHVSVASNFKKDTYMIVFAIIIYILLNLTPKWILKERYNQLESNFNWTIPFIKLTGLVFCFFLAFLLIFGTTKSTKDTYIENKNAVYGLEFNNTMEVFGFQDSMKIKSINGQGIDRVSDIVKKIILENGETEVVVEKNGIQSIIILSEADKISIMQNPKTTPALPIMYDLNGENEILITTTNYGFSEVLDRFGTLWKQALIIINPNLSVYKSIGGFVSISKINNIRGYLMVFSLNLVIIGILNLLPLPGFSMGNLLISTIETLRKKLYNKKRKRVIGWISIFLVIGILIIRLT